MNILELLLGQIPEALFMALFMIFAKNIKQKRVIFVILMILEYLLIKYSFRFNWIFHILFMVMTYLTLKVLYHEKAQITDVFIFVMGYLIIIITSVICFAISSGNPITASILNRILIFVPLLILNYRLYAIQNMYKHYWNRSNKPKKVKSLTFRCINIVIFNILFVIINVGMLVATYYNTLVK